MEYRQIVPDEINRDFFREFKRRQVVENCRRRVDGQWVVVNHPFVDDWAEEDFPRVVAKITGILEEGGLVLGAFEEGALKGFVAVRAKRFGSRGQYLDLASIHVSEELRGHGVGRVLFAEAKKWAREKGAEKLYISAHSAVESQAFYRAMGCVDAEEWSDEHVRGEPYDCQLECRVRTSDFVIDQLSSRYRVSILNETDIPVILTLYKGNPLYFHHCPPAASEDGVRRDMVDLPKGKGSEDKLFLGFWDCEELVAVLELILRYPDERTAFIGFFIMAPSRQGGGVGSVVVEEICACLGKQFEFVRLAYVLGNPQAEHFWKKNGFLPTGVVAHTEQGELVVMQIRVSGE